MRRHEDSLRLLGDAYRLDNFDWRVQQLFALNYVVLDIRDGALAELQTAVSLNTRNAELHYQLARFYHSDGRIAESIVESRKALDIFPDYAEAYENLGLCYGVLADKQQAVDNFERAIAIQGRLGQKNEWPFVNYAEFLIKQNESESALRLLQRALEVNPSSAKANYFMGMAMRSLDRNAEARLYLEQALKLDAPDPDPTSTLGMLLMRLCDPSASKPLLDRFQQLRNPATKGSTQR